MNNHNLAQAAQHILQGKVVAFPTETVYGLGADATNQDAVLKIYQLKQRPNHNPLIVHCYSLSQAQTIGQFNSLAHTLAAAFWPGPMTLVLPLQPHHNIAAAVRANRNTIALRIPNHPLALQLLEHSQVPIAAPSANLSGKLSATNAEIVFQFFGNIPEVFILSADASSECQIGLESTIIDCTALTPRILRPGGITAEQLNAIINNVATLDATQHDPAELIAPGMMASHYAPNLPVRLNATTRSQPSEALLGFGPMIESCDLNLSPQGDLKEAAHNLFKMLWQLDHQPFSGIAVAPIPEHGLGVAINDRLRRAAYERR